MIQEGKHLTCEGIKAILEIRREMNDGGKRVYCEEEILKRFLPAQSSETTRQSSEIQNMI
jgi:hypothetical protein